MAVKKGLGRGLDILIPKDNNKKIENNNDVNTNEATVGEGSVNEKRKKKKSTVKYKVDNDTNGAVKAGDQKDQLLENRENGKEESQFTVDINKIEPNRNQPRKQFDEESLEELADSIKQYGLLQPIIVKKNNGYYEIIAGERRWRACKAANLKEVPVIIKEYSDSDTLKISLIENLQRENLNPIEEAQAYNLLSTEYGLKQEEIAESVSKSRTAVTNTMRLLRLDERIQNLIMEDQITHGHGRALLSIEDKELQYKTALRIRDNNLSVREAERMVKRILLQLQSDGEGDNEKTFEKSKDDKEIQLFEETLKEIIGSKVVIKNRRNNKGKIEIDYYSKEEFERIVELLQKIK